MTNADSRKRAAGLRKTRIRSKRPRISQDGVTPRFVADVMLGRLAKWLRIAGFDVLYSNRSSDDDLVAISRNENRILLSRDTRLLVRKAVEQFIFLESEKVEEQIRQIFRETGTTRLPAALTRCPVCNETLADVAREQVREAVPPYVFETQKQFKICLNCRKVFWAGTHRQSVLGTLDRLLRDVEPAP